MGDKSASGIPELESQLAQERERATRLESEFATCQNRMRQLETFTKDADLLQNFLDAVPDVVAIQDVENHIIRYNRAGYELLDMSPEEVRGRHCWSLVGREEPCAECATRICLEERAPARIEKYMPELDAWLEARSYPVMDEKGDVRLVIEHIRDITDSKHAEIALKESEEKYRSVIENIRDAFYRTDAEGRLIMVSPSGLKLLGYDSQEEVLGRHSGEFWKNPQQRQDFLELLMQKGAVEDYEVELLHRDGSVIPVATSTVLLKDEQGNVQGVEGIFRDVRERKRAEAALRESEETFRKLFEWSADPNLLIEGNRFVECNRAAVEILGFESREQLIGIEPEVISPRYQPDGQLSRDKARAMINKARVSGAHHFDWVHQRADGETFVVDVSLVPFSLRGRDMLYVTWRDITARLRAHEELERLVAVRTQDLRIANEKLRELDEMKSSFLSSASHELRTPLTSVLGFAKLIQREAGRLDGGVSSEADRRTAARRIGENAAIIVNESSRLTRLINDLLDLNKIDSGHMKWNEEHVDLAAVAREAVDSMRGHEAMTPELSITASIPDGLPLIWADPDRIKQVLVNLLGNAVKYTREGQVRFSVREARPEGLGAGRWLECVVSDNGPGIPAAELDRVFMKFYQGSSRAEKSKGTGLGLAISKQIVDHYNGRIWVESDTGQGATFHVLLPCREL